MSTERTIPECYSIWYICHTTLCFRGLLASTPPSKKKTYQSCCGTAWRPLVLHPHNKQSTSADSRQCTVYSTSWCTYLCLIYVQNSNALNCWDGMNKGLQNQWQEVAVVQYKVLTGIHLMGLRRWHKFLLGQSVSKSWIVSDPSEHETWIKMVMKHHSSQEEISALIIQPDKFRYVPDINVLFAVWSWPHHMEHLHTVIT